MAKASPETKITCPKCGSDQVKVELRSAGTTSKTNYYRTGVKKSWFIPSGYKTRESQRNYKSIAVCQNCGHHWEVGTPGCLTTVISWVIVIAILVVAFKACSGSSSNSSADSPSDETQRAPIWASGYTPLDQFTYSIENSAIIIERYTGSEKAIWIAPSYNIDGISYEVSKVSGPIPNKYVESIIISDGISEIEHNVFNFGSYLSDIYVPSTIADLRVVNDSLYYLHADEVFIYFGGTKENWEANYNATLHENVSVFFQCSIENGGVSIGN